MKYTDLPTYPCCRRPNIKPLMREPAVNTLCLKCGRHWYGSDAMVCVYSRAEWDRQMNEAMP